ncbi:hypothetical protein [Marinobacter shengliensis]|uniref:hypothetical protein n=1 Tax=Marinobacter shengliensis TaxID=1389223 RepID=UPI0011084E0B|nr:hypothetical protein [Marinobacter shengliensis]
MKLKNSVINRIKTELESGDFCKEDFEILESEQKDSIIKIIFKPKKEYYFEIFETTIKRKRVDRSPLANLSGLNHEYEEEENATLTIESPGNYKVVESNQVSNLDAAINRIESWTTNIREEITQTSLNKKMEIEEDLSWFQERVDKDIENPEDNFTEEEAHRIHDKLETLRKRIEELETKIGCDESIKIAAEETIQKTKDDLKIYPKGIWYKTAGNKLLNLMKSIVKTQEGRQVLAETVKNLLK